MRTIRGDPSYVCCGLLRGLGLGVSVLSKAAFAIASFPAAANALPLPVVAAEATDVLVFVAALDSLGTLTFNDDALPASGIFRCGFAECVFTADMIDVLGCWIALVATHLRLLVFYYRARILLFRFCYRYRIARTLWNCPIPYILVITC